MKILFISKFYEPDYQNDCFYHGLVSLQNKFPHEYEVSILDTPEFMLEGFDKLSSLYGRGFTLYGTLKNNAQIVYGGDAFSNILSKKYDLIIYGSIRRDQRYLQNVLERYSKDQIICLDGEDHPYIDDYLAKHTRYCKRELFSERSDVEPLSFAIPKDKIIRKDIGDKVNIFSDTSHKGSSEKYTFDNEQDYYMSYSNSYYGRTSKKGGWDCLRHYEIFASYCVPYFIGIENCPERTLTTLPKNLLTEVNKYASKNQIHPFYNEIVEECHMFALERLTTEALVTKVLK